MPTFFQFRTYLNYWLDAVDSHSLHSPFFFDLYDKVLLGDDGKDHSRIEELRKKLLNNPTPLAFADLGAGSQSGKKQRTVADIARTSLSPARFSRLYSRLIEHFDSENILELGTSLGINTLYLASHPRRRVLTFEGASSIAAVARSTFEFASARNISIIEGDIDVTLSRWIEDRTKVDFALMDANHRCEPTLRYFNLLTTRTHSKSLIVVDDIHYSPEMERAWEEIRRHPNVQATADLYRAGLVFFDPSLNKQHVVLQF